MAEQSEHEDGDEAVVWGSAYPPSINAGIPKLGELPAGWLRLRMKDMLDVIERPVKLVDSQTYQLVTAKRSRGGIVSRGTLRGDEIKVKQQFEVRSGDFILSNRQIAHGGCGIVPPELDGAVVSGEYTVLHPKPMLDLRFLHYLTHSAYFQQICFHSGVGVHVEKLVFRLHDWLNWQIDIPPLHEQQRIAEVLADIDGAIGATDLLVEAKQRRKRALMQHLFDDAQHRSELMDFVDLITTKTKETAGQPSIELECIEGGTGRVLDTIVVGQDAGPRLAFKAGDTLFGKLRPYLRKFAYAYSDGLCSTEIWALRPKSGVCHPRYLFHVVQLPAFDQAATKPTGSKMPRAEWELVSAAPLPLPSLDRQVAIAQLLDAAETEANVLADQANMLREQRRGLMQRLLSGDCKHRSRIMEEVAV